MTCVQPEWKMGQGVVLTPAPSSPHRLSCLMALSMWASGWGGSLLDTEDNFCLETASATPNSPAFFKCLRCAGPTPTPFMHDVV